MRLNFLFLVLLAFLAQQYSCRICSGRTSACNTAWNYYSSDGIKVTVDISKCGFTSEPVVTCSLHGQTSHWTASGGSQPYKLTNKSFDIYIKQASITADLARERCWHIHWIAVKQDEFIDE
eukprot:TRINITY_DN3582_c0_g1_i1.p4 TRINITY_DN3582_c0_g1~~TRINITY_DN3582_c0_g1_i1.p4  ORF type:complete len:121 (-),score=0.25 TRINITY_DN3582_c0_g1_i1:249-611(-)